MLATIAARFIHAPCPCCEQRIRFTVKVAPDNALVIDSDLIERGLELHLRYACEAGPK